MRRSAPRRRPSGLAVPVPTPAGPPATLTLYRLTPSNITDLVNKDTGNAEGDAFFTLDEYDLPMRCSHGVSTNARGCFLDVDDVYMAAVQMLTVSVECELINHGTQSGETHIG